MDTILAFPKDGRHSGPQLEWTGERYVTSVGGEIEFEHTHRYLFAMPFAEGATVLDIASGEGYGSSLLGSVAHRVIGIDIDENSVAHAQAKYKSDNLVFMRGECTAIPLSSDTVDVVVSFETLEHIVDHKKFLCEVSRVLKPDGVLIISTPDRVPYNEVNAAPNPYHLKELDRAEFKLLLSRHFKLVQLLGQCYLEGSVIDPLRAGSDEDREVKGNNRWVRYIEEPMRARKRLARSIYLIGVASNRPLAKSPANLLTTAPGRQARWEAIRRAQNAELTSTREADQLRATLAAAEEQQRALREAVSNSDRAAEALRADIEQRAATEAALRSEIEQRAATEAALRTDIEQRTATEAALRTDIEKRTATEAALRTDIERRAATEAALRTDIEQRAAIEAALRRALDLAERDAEIRGARAEAEKAEILGMRAALAKADSSVREHHSALAAIQAEINSLRRELRDAETIASESAAAAATRQAEIGVLRTELAAARDIGKAALASLRITPTPILPPPRNAGWPRVMLRPFGRPVNYSLPSPS